MQYTDARDLAAWVTRMLDAAASGTYNGVGPGYDIPISDVLAACLKAAAGENGADHPSRVKLMVRSSMATWIPLRQRPYKLGAEHFAPQLDSEVRQALTRGLEQREQDVVGGRLGEPQDEPRPTSPRAARLAASSARSLLMSTLRASPR